MLKFLRGIKVSFWRDWSRVLAYVLEIEYGEADIQIMIDLAHPRVQVIRDEIGRMSDKEVRDEINHELERDDEVPF